MVPPSQAYRAMRQATPAVKAGVKKVGPGLETVTTIAANLVTIFGRGKSTPDKWHPKSEVKGAKVEGEKHDIFMKPPEYAVPRSSRENRASLFSELELDDLPQTRTIHLTMVVGGRKRTIKVRIKVSGKLSLAFEFYLPNGRALILLQGRSMWPRPSEN